MLAALNQLMDVVEAPVAEEIDVAGVAARHGATEHHLRRMFSSLAGMPLSAYVRRRRMTLAAAEVAGSSDDLLSIAVRHGYGSTEAFGRAFRAVHGVGPGEARRDGGPFRSQQQLRFRLTVEGSTTMHVRITDRPAFRLVGHATRVPLIHEGVNPHIQAHVAAIPMEEHLRLKALGDADPGGILQVTDDVEPDSPEGAELTYLHGVAVSAGTAVPDDLDSVAVAAGSWAVFTSEGPYPGPCRRPGPRPPRSGSPRTRGGCAPDRRSWRSSSATMPSRLRRLSCGCRWSGADAGRVRRRARSSGPGPPYSRVGAPVSQRQRKRS